MCERESMKVEVKDGGRRSQDDVDGRTGDAAAALMSDGCEDDDPREREGKHVSRT